MKTVILRHVTFLEHVKWNVKIIFVIITIMRGIAGNTIKTAGIIPAVVPAINAMTAALTMIIAIAAVMTMIAVGMTIVKITAVLSGL